MSKRTRASFATICIAVVGIAAPSRDAKPADPHPVKIGIIGAGKIGGTLATLWVKGGHEVLISSRHPDELQGLARSLGPKARVGTPREAAVFGDVVLISVPYAALPQIGKDLRQWQQNPADSAVAQALLRALHTVKGSARMAGAMRLGQHTHALETQIENMVHAGTTSLAAFDELLANYDQAMLLFEQLQQPADAAPAQPASLAPAPAEPAAQPPVQPP